MADERPRILALWADPDSPNLGVGLLAQGFEAGVRDWADVTFASHRLLLNGSPLSLKNLLAACLTRRSRLGLALAEFDLVVDIGEGDSFASIYGWKRFAKLAASKLAATRAGTSLVVGPQTLGPWHGRFYRSVARLVCGRARTVWARDSASAARASAVGIRARVAHDLSFGLSKLADTPFASPPMHVLLNVSGLLWKEDNHHVDARAYREFVRTLASQLRGDGVALSFLAHVVAPGSADDDSYIAHELAAEFGTTAIVTSDLKAVRKAVAQADLVIGSRMHACLNALNQGVPTIAVAYSDKFQALFEDIGYLRVFDLRKGRGAPLTGDIIDLVRTADLASEAAIAQRTAAERLELFFGDLRSSLR